MSLLDSIKKGLMGEGDEYEDQYIDDGPQMVNNNSGIGIGMDEEPDEPAEGTSKKNKVVNIHATTQLKVVLVKPERFEDASTIADHLNNKRTVVLNLESTNKETSWRTMAHSIDPAAGAVRGFVPARNDEERYLMRHIEDLANAAFSRGTARYSAFLSDREQDLARAALGRAGVRDGWRFDGGWPDAERRVLCLEPEYSYGECPVRCVQLQCRALPGAALPAHKDYLGSLMGLALKREALGDILLPADAPGTAYVFALESAAKLICRELCQAGRTEVSTRLLEPDEIPVFPAPERQLLTATVSSLRLDAVLSAMLHVSRGTAAELIEAGRVEINHLPVEKPHAPVFEQDVFTVRGKGRFRLTALPGKSKKDRSIIEFFQY